MPSGSITERRTDRHRLKDAGMDHMNGEASRQKEQTCEALQQGPVCYEPPGVSVLGEWARRDSWGSWVCRILSQRHQNSYAWHIWHLLIILLSFYGFGTSVTISHSLMMKTCLGTTKEAFCSFAYAAFLPTYAHRLPRMHSFSAYCAPWLLVILTLSLVSSCRYASNLWLPGFQLSMPCVWWISSL